MGTDENFAAAEVTRLEFCPVPTQEDSLVLRVVLA
jgi:hypothetical protein